MIYTTLRLFIKVIEYAIIIDVILSLLASTGTNVKFHDVIRNFVKPVLQPFDKLQSKLNLNMPIDLSPLLALFALSILRQLIYIVFI